MKGKKEEKKAKQQHMVLIIVIYGRIGVNIKHQQSYNDRSFPFLTEYLLHSVCCILTMIRTSKHNVVDF